MTAGRVLRRRFVYGWHGSVAWGGALGGCGTAYWDCSPSWIRERRWFALGICVSERTPWSAAKAIIPRCLRNVSGRCDAIRRQAAMLDLDGTWYLIASHFRYQQCSYLMVYLGSVNVSTELMSCSKGSKKILIDLCRSIGLR